MSNRLAKRSGDGNGKLPPGISRISAAEWASLARSKGLFKHADAWEQARIMGWDEEHYRPDA